MLRQIKEATQCIIRKWRMVFIMGLGRRGRHLFEGISETTTNCHGNWPSFD